ncbi:OsmC family protein [Planomicrobium sp. CPCC 101079]|uniref:OsmC family protein n=1 Tax=Planomicrobium sp. CPCC 101079 TaxID=2599618 RepID=UPI0011B7AD8D|nr:OsmC family protein [Planomicrobium sp. CPCC 101079]TWT09257.1 OsmC family protein [Planomicrobium sp. CPCC 101079]
MKATLNWDGGMAFSGKTESGHLVLLDAGPESGGENKGPRPPEVLLHAAAVCTGMDIVYVLEKMRLKIDKFFIEIEGIRATEHPKRFTEMSIIYHINGKLPEDKVKRAIKLSSETYCTVVHSINAKVQYKYSLNEEPVKKMESL